MGFVRVLNNFVRVQTILYVYQIVYAYKTIFYMLKSVLYEDTYTTILHVYDMCVPIKNVLYMYTKFVYAYQMLCAHTRECYMRTSYFICVQKVFCVYKIVCTRTQ